VFFNTVATSVSKYCGRLHVCIFLIDLVCNVDHCVLGSTEQLCTRLASDLTYAVVQATDMYSQVTNINLDNALVDMCVFGCSDISVA